jgi:hypothetical protein
MAIAGPFVTIRRTAVRIWCGKAESVKVTFDAELWLRGARRTQGWTFVGPPASQSEEIRDLAGGPSAGRTRTSPSCCSCCSSSRRIPLSSSSIPVRSSILHTGSSSPGSSCAPVVAEYPGQHPRAGRRQAGYRKAAANRCSARARAHESARARDRDPVLTGGGHVPVGLGGGLGVPGRPAEHPVH